jgi:hypothetical protein
VHGDKVSFDIGEYWSECKGKMKVKAMNCTVISGGGGGNNNTKRSKEDDKDEFDSWVALLQNPDEKPLVFRVYFKVQSRISKNTENYNEG